VPHPLLAAYFRRPLRVLSTASPLELQVVFSHFKRELYQQPSVLAQHTRMLKTCRLSDIYPHVVYTQGIPQYKVFLNIVIPWYPKGISSRTPTLMDTKT
jgi:hypothetical protein